MGTIAALPDLLGSLSLFGCILLLTVFALLVGCMCISLRKPATGLGKPLPTCYRIYFSSTWSSSLLQWPLVNE